MFEAFECRCIYVEFSNRQVAHSGRIEYRAMSCEVCRARDALLRGTSTTVLAFEAQAPRYQRMH